MYFSGNGEIDTDMDTNILDTNTDINTHINTDAYSEELEKLKNDPRIELMKKYRQHKNSTTYDHVCHVAEMSHKIEKGLHLHDIDEQAMLRGAVLHDYYQYDFRDHPIGPWRHGTSHAGQALENAEAAFELSDKEKDIIYMRALSLMSSAIGTLKKRVIDLEKLSIDNGQEHTRVLDQISRL